MRSEAFAVVDRVLQVPVPRGASYVSIPPTTATLQVEMLAQSDELLTGYRVEFSRGVRFVGGFGTALAIPAGCVSVRLRHDSKLPVAAEVWFIVGCNSGGARNEA